MNFQAMGKQRKFIFIAAVVGIVSVFFPWSSWTTGSANGFHTYGIVAFLSFIAATAISLLGNQTKTLGKSLWIVSMRGKRRDLTSFFKFW